MERVLLGRTLCHLDLFAANLLFDEAAGDIQFIDYEYAAGVLSQLLVFFVDDDGCSMDGSHGRWIMRWSGWRCRCCGWVGSCEPHVGLHRANRWRDRHLRYFALPDRSAAGAPLPAVRFCHQHPHTHQPAAAIPRLIHNAQDRATATCSDH